MTLLCCFIRISSPALMFTSYQRDVRTTTDSALRYSPSEATKSTTFATWLAMRTTFDYIIAVSQPGAVRVEGKLFLPSLDRQRWKWNWRTPPLESHVESAVLLVMSGVRQHWRRLNFSLAAECPWAGRLKLANTYYERQRILRVRVLKSLFIQLSSSPGAVWRL